MKLIGSLRVSSIEQANGDNLDDQEAAIRRWARRSGHRLVAVYSDAGLSGALPAEDRPGLTDALLDLRAGRADGLLVRDLDRLAREVTVQEAVLAEVWRMDRAVFTVTGEVLRDDPDDPYRTAMRQMMGVFAGLERRLIVKRLRDGRRAKAERGGHAVGPPPYGWKATGGVLVPIPAEQAALRLMHRLAAEGRSTREIATALRDGEHPTKRGGAWSSPVVARILGRSPKRTEVA